MGSFFLFFSFFPNSKRGRHFLAAGDWEDDTFLSVKDSKIKTVGTVPGARRREVLEALVLSSPF